MTMEGTLIACNMLGFSLGSPGPSTALGRMMAQKMAAPTRTAERQTMHDVKILQKQNQVNLMFCLNLWDLT